MTRGEFRDDRCMCGARLSGADHVERHKVVFASGEFEGEPGVAIIAECACGQTSVIALAVNLRRAA